MQNQDGNGAQDRGEGDGEGGVDDPTAEVMGEVTAALRTNLSQLESEFRTMFDERMSTFAAQREDEKSLEAARKKKEVLCTNKVFRDVARPLGAKWKPVFQRLLCGLPQERIAAETAKVEAEKPFMQAYKSLMLWKEVCAETFDIRQLIDAFEENDHGDLARMTRNILDSEEDSLFSLAEAIPGKSGPGGAGTPAGLKVVPPAPSDDPLCGTEALGGGAERPPLAAGQIKPTPAASANARGAAEGQRASGEGKISNEEALDDRHILQLAKKVGGDWEPLARSLGLGPDEIKEILEGEGKTYQGAFKVLWTWRDTVDAVSAQSVGKLKSALVNMNRLDLAMMYH